MSIADHIRAIRAELPPTTSLIAVSKTHPAERLQEAYDAGQRHFGENYGQELRDKVRQLPADIRWHFLGALQKNKIKYVAPNAYRVHGLTHLEQGELLAARAPSPIQVLVNVNLGLEPGKSGLPPEELPALLDQLSQVDNLAAIGLMCIPPASDDPAASAPWFAQLAHLAHEAQARGHHGVVELSMGMSADYTHAVAHGATWVRVGTAIFGQR